jgi:hypothetical protein
MDRLHRHRPIMHEPTARTASNPPMLADLPRGS